MTTDRSIWITTDNVIVTGKHKVDLGTGALDQYNIWKASEALTFGRFTTLWVWKCMFYSDSGAGIDLGKWFLRMDDVLKLSDITIWTHSYTFLKVTDIKYWAVSPICIK